MIADLAQRQNFIPHIPFLTEGGDCKRTVSAPALNHLGIFPIVLAFPTQSLTACWGGCEHRVSSHSGMTAANPLARRTLTEGEGGVLLSWRDLPGGQLRRRFPEGVFVHKVGSRGKSVPWETLRRESQEKLAG